MSTLNLFNLFRPVYKNKYYYRVLLNNNNTTAYNTQKTFNNNIFNFFLHYKNKYNYLYQNNNYTYIPTHNVTKYNIIPLHKLFRTFSKQIIKNEKQLSLDILKNNIYGDTKYFIIYTKWLKNLNEYEIKIFSSEINIFLAEYISQYDNFLIIYLLLAKVHYLLYNYDDNTYNDIKYMINETNKIYDIKIIKQLLEWLDFVLLNITKNNNYCQKYNKPKNVETFIKQINHQIIKYLFSKNSKNIKYSEDYATIYNKLKLNISSYELFCNNIIIKNNIKELNNYDCYLSSWMYTLFVIFNRIKEMDDLHTYDSKFAINIANLTTYLCSRLNNTENKFLYILFIKFIHFIESKIENFIINSELFDYN